VKIKLPVAIVPFLDQEHGKKVVLAMAVFHACCTSKADALFSTRKNLRWLPCLTCLPWLIVRSRLPKSGGPNVVREPEFVAIKIEILHTAEDGPLII
jgi:hypothetical protein